MQDFIKNFKQWLLLKEKLHYAAKPVPFINEGEIWWCSVGINVGHEIDGKSELFVRPVLIFKKLSEDTFWGIPGTTQNKNGNWFVDVIFQEKKQVFILAEIRSLSVRRLDKRIGTLSEDNMAKIINAFIGLLPKNRPT